VAVATPTQEPPLSPVSIRITSATRKALEHTLRQACQAGDLPLVKRVTALLGIARGEPVGPMAAGVDMRASTVYAWLAAFLLEGVAGLRVQGKGGRPAKLTPRPSGGGDAPRERVGDGPRNVRRYGNRPPEPRLDYPRGGDPPVDQRGEAASHMRRGCGAEGSGAGRREGRPDIERVRPRIAQSDLPGHHCDPRRVDAG
jgi:hypothetical protein